jgi:hypothetical protein
LADHFILYRATRGDLIGEKLFKEFDVQATPFLLFMDGDRKIIDWIAGYTPPAAKWQAQIAAVLTGKDTALALSDQIRTEPKNPVPRIKLGIKYQARYLRQFALPLFEEAAALDPEGKIMMPLDDGENVSCREMADYQYARTFVVTWGTIEPERLEKFIRAYPKGVLLGRAFKDLARMTSPDDDEGAAVYMSLMEKRPRDPEVLDRYASELQQYQDKPAAMKTLDRGLDFADQTVRSLSDANVTDAALNHAQLWLLKGNPEKAEEVFGPAFEGSQVERWAEALMRYAEFWSLKNRNLEDANRSIELALKICPENAALRRTAARIYLSLPEKAGKAAEAYGPEFLRNLEANATELYEYFSFWLSRKANEESALSALKALLRLKPESVHYRSSAANAFIKAGRNDEALAVFGPDFISRHGNEHPVLFDYGSFWIERKSNLDSAVPALVKACKESPRIYADHARAAEALSRAGRAESLKEVFGPDYLPHTKDNALGLCQYASFWLSRKENEASALEALDMASKLPDLGWFDRLFIAQHYVKANQESRAEAIYGPAYLKSILGDAAGLTNYATFWLRMRKNMSSAAEAARLSCRLDEKSSEAWATLAELLFVDGKYAEAMKAVGQALALTTAPRLVDQYGKLKTQIAESLKKNLP